VIIRVIRVSLRTIRVSLRAIRVFTSSKPQLNAAARPQCRPVRLRYEQSPLETAIGTVVETDGSAAEYFQCSLCSRRFALRLQYYAPMSGGECHRTTIGALDTGRTVHELVLHTFVAFCLRTTASAFCPKKRKKNKQFKEKCKSRG